MEKEDQPGYVTHLITTNSLNFIEANADRPFFLFVSHEAVHLPFQTPDDTPENRKPIPKEDRWKRERIRPKYKIMLEVMDHGIGQILDALNKHGIAENTLVLFLSDNGSIGAGSSLPWRGGKFSHYEGGHRVPAIAWWPGTIKPGYQNGCRGDGHGLHADRARLRGHPRLQKIAHWMGSALKIYWWSRPRSRSGNCSSVTNPSWARRCRDGDWKMIVKAGNQQLYNLADDPGERTNLAEQQPERAEAMVEAIEAWKRVVTPGS